MTASNAADLLIGIAREDVGKSEVSHNRAPWIKKYWPCTSYPEGWDERAPYCAAGQAYVLKTFLERLAERGELRATMGMGSKEAEKWRCKSAGAYRWRDWAEAKGIKVVPEQGEAKPGDFIVFDFSHIGLVVEEFTLKGRKVIHSIEMNTNEGGSREGDGCWEKVRDKTLAQCFIRILNW